MGWWSTTVMGGDTPMDYMCDLEEVGGKNPQKNIKKVIAHAKKVAKSDDADSDYVGIMRQVLGVFMIERGIKMSDDIREFILKGIESDDWATTDKERKAHMDAFYKQVKNFKGKAATVPYEGLFEKMLAPK